MHGSKEFLSKRVMPAIAMHGNTGTSHQHGAQCSILGHYYCTPPRQRGSTPSCTQVQARSMAGPAFEFQEVMEQPNKQPIKYRKITGDYVQVRETRVCVCRVCMCLSVRAHVCVFGERGVSS